MKYILLIVSHSLFLSSVSIANNNLPSFNAKASTCAKVTVNKLKSNPATAHLDKLNHGYELSPDCNTIFVHPPLYGEIEVDAAALSSTVRLCPSHLATMDTINALTVRRFKFFDSPAKYDQMSSSIDRLWREMYSRGQLSVATTLRMVMSLRWNELVEAYETNNPSFNVVKLPVYHSLLASSAEDLRDSNPSEVQLPPLIYSYIPDYTENLDDEGPLGKKTYGYEFDGTKGAQIGLSYSGVCGLYNAKTQTIHEDSWENLSAYIVSNVTYFYPVQVSYGYTATVDTEAFLNVFNQVAARLSKVGGFVYMTYPEYQKVVNELRSAGSISVKLSDSAKRNYTPSEVATIEQETFKQYVNFIIGHIADTSSGNEKDGTVNFDQRTYKIDLSKVSDKINRVSTFFSKSMEHTQEMLLAGSFTFRSKKDIEAELEKTEGVK
jgi:hypothetical protein